MRKKVTLVALMSGQGKTGKPWYRVLLKAKAPDGTSVVREHWLDEDVGKEAVRAGLLDDCTVLVDCGLDNYLRANITSITAEEDEVLIE